MYRIIVLTGIIFLLATGIVFAKSNKNTMPAIKFNGTKYTLSYSAKSAETGGYLNEYYKANQTYASWTELMGIHHYPTAYYPIEHAKEFTEYLKSSGVPVSMETYDNKNEAVLFFIITDERRLPIIMEFNVFKYVKSPICGTVASQYARRYRINSPLEKEKVRKDIIKHAPKSIKKMIKFEVPEIINLEAENGKYIIKEGCNDHMENLD